MYNHNVFPNCGDIDWSPFFKIFVRDFSAYPCRIMGLSDLIFGLNVSCTGCIPSLRSMIARRDILFSVFCFSIYLLKAWFSVEKVGVLVIIFSSRKWRERKILHHLPQSFWGPWAGPDPCRKAASSRRERVTSDPLSDLRTHHFGLATPLPMCVKWKSNGISEWGGGGSHWQEYQQRASDTYNWMYLG